MEMTSLIFVCLAVVILGVSKAGFGGVGTAVALPTMSLGVSPEVALGVLLPLLLAAGVVSVTAHRKQMDMRSILIAVPGAIVGVLLGSLVIDSAPPNVVAGTIGVLAIMFAFLALTNRKPKVSSWPHWVGSVFGGLSGLTSTVAHAGGPPIHIYFLAKSFSPTVFVATSAGFMAAVNVLKIGPYFVIGTLDSYSFKLAVMLAPIAIASAFFGVYLARTLSKQSFKIAVNLLLIVVGIKLLHDAFF